MLILLLGLFSCVEKPRLHIDDDGDGYSEFEGDCDDTNPNAYPGAAELDSTELCMVDNDGDGYGDDSVEGLSGSEGHQGTDCDDNDATTVNDMDCDGFTTTEDCDDNDENSTSILEDADCDGVITADDCDDGDATTVDDMDCDGILAADDCDDMDASTVNDMDCDGVLASDDCDDGDANNMEEYNDCCDLIDNDGDGWIDMQDPDCEHLDQELAEHLGSSCNDGIDNDADGWIDAMDLGCESAFANESDGYHDLEGDGVPNFECNDGIDNDVDGWIDVQDSDCVYAHDNESL